MKNSKLLPTAVLAISFLMTGQVLAVTPAQDIAALIKLRNHDCGGAKVTNVKETNDAQGNKTITATCPNGKRYRISVSAAGKVRVKPL